MTEGPGAKDAPHPSTHEERTSGQDLFGLGEWDRRALLDWVGGHLTQGAAVGVRPATPALEPGDRRGGWPGRACWWYLLKAWVTTEPLGLVADLLYALGFALWTGVVVVFVQVIPEVKRRQFKQALDAYETAQREQARAGADQASGEDAARQRGSGRSPRVELAGTYQRAARAEGASGSVTKGPARVAAALPGPLGDPRARTAAWGWGAG
jgi:hypothetical protein